MIKNLVKKILPPVIVDGAWHLKNKISENKNWNRIKDVVKKSEELKDIHKGKRIFIVGTGASIKNQNLLPLKDEIVIGLNEFFLHPDFDTIKPTYNIFSGYYCHTTTISETTIKKWYSNFENALKKTGTIAILPIQDFDFLKTNNLMSNGTVEKYCFNWNTSPLDIEKYEFRSLKKSYAGQSVSVTAICMAIYMGTKEIYLLGFDHDWILTYQDKIQKHFYADNKSVIYSNLAEFNTNQLVNQFKAYVQLFEEYKAINDFSKNNNINIINLTEGGLLDIFPRQNFEAFSDIKD